MKMIIFFIDGGTVFRAQTVPCRFRPTLLDSDVVRAPGSG